MKKLLIPIAVLLGLAYACAPLVFWDLHEAGAARDRRTELAQAGSYAGQPNVIASLDMGAPHRTLYAMTDVDGGAPVAAAPVADLPEVDAPDPETDPLGFLGKLHRMWKDGALAPAAILLAWAVALIASRKIAWLRESKRAMWTAAALSVLAAIAEPAARGTTPSLIMILSAVLSAVVLALRAEVPPPKAV